jgi:hypothetical protein
MHLFIGTALASYLRAHGFIHSHLNLRVFLMLRNATSVGLAHHNFTTVLVRLIVLGLIVLPLTGCSDDGQSGPILSSLSTPTDAPSGEDASSDPTATESTVEEDPTISMPDTLADWPTREGEDSDPAADPQYSGGDEDPMISVSSTLAGATARLSWDAHPDPTVAGYRVYYGKQSSGEPGSCSYEESQSFETARATITGLEPNTPYFFAISAYGGEGGELESPCSNEVLVVTPTVQS